MKLKHKELTFCVLLLVVFLAFPVNGYAKLKVGWLVDINADGGEITIDEALGFPEKRYMTYTITDTAKWHICIQKACILKEGREGFPAFKESVDREAYGMPYRSFRVLLDVKAGKVRALEVQITTKMH
ncbi:MAG: hypothetical protein IMF07_03865 [Proteobacteria bacterium]|nr:hypothetical protein [Pseudomonadota bacterium]